MAERRPPGFNVPLGFYDGPEVESIPRRIRAAAIGVWTLCGTFSANKLQDGYVGPEMMKQLGCTDAIRDALMSTRGPDGAPDPLWQPARDGGVQFTKWVKYQRSRAEVKAYRDQDAERKKAERNRTKPPPTSGDPKMSGRTLPGHVSDYREPKTETETETKRTTHLDDERNVSNGAEVVDYEPPEFIDNAARPEKPQPSSAAKTVVRQELGSSYPRTTVDRLAVQVGKLAREGHADPTIREALREWDRRPGDMLPEYLPTVLGDVVKRSRAAPAEPHKMRAFAELAAEERAREESQFATARKEISR